MKNYKINLAFHAAREDAEFLYELICKNTPRSIGVNLLPRQDEKEKNVIVLTFQPGHHHQQAIRRRSLTTAF